MTGRDCTDERGVTAAPLPQPRLEPSPARKLPPLSIQEACAGMIVQDVVVRPSEVVFVKGIIEASDGIAAVFAERGGDLTLAAPEGRGAEFAELLIDLERDVGVRLCPSGSLSR